MTRASASVATLTKANGPLAKALDLPNGARFYRCALQVNPFPYLNRHQKQSSFTDEKSYNDAIVAACLENTIEVIAITDHYRVKESESLAEAAKAAGIIVFPAFEAVTKDGVHFLCYFAPDKNLAELERHIGACEVFDPQGKSPTGKFDSTELLEKASEWVCVLVAAHVTNNGGLLKKLSGQTRVQAWCHDDLMACALPGPISAAPPELRQILENKDPAHKRSRPVAVINAGDVNSPEDLAEPSSSCWIKMSSVSVEGLRQAFLDPESRIRLASDPPPEDHSEFLALTWQGGFLDEAAIHFNENLNTLIGGRGAGKSTVIESLRYVLGLEPIGEEAQRMHDGIVQQVLRSGTKISLMVRSHHPAKRTYVIERTVPNPPLVREEGGNVLTLTPLDVLPGVEVYGQHEISELAKSREKLTRLLERFVERDADVSRRKADVRRELDRSRQRILENQRETQQVAERLASLPALEETLKRFQEAGLEERLKEQSFIVREEQVLKTVAERIDTVRTAAESISRVLPIDRAFVSAKALETLPGRETLSKADPILAALEKQVAASAQTLTTALDRAESALTTVRAEWEQRKKAVQQDYEKILRELQKSKIDGAEFIKLRRQIEELRPLKDRETALQREAAEQAAHRRNLAAEWEDLKAQEFRSLQTAANRVTRALEKRVRVEVTMGGNREALAKLLREVPGIGRLAEAIKTLTERPELSLQELAAACRAGKEALSKKFAITPGQADKLAQCPPEIVLRIEELDLGSTTRIELNTAAEGEEPQWQTLEQLSTGQKATAVLLLLLLESDAPLVVDQPEDDLDNRFITDGVVPKMREEKRRRQFLFSTHNANIPVLGDAELIVGLSTAGDQQQVHGRVSSDYMGSIDSPKVQTLVEEILEGGRVAFEMRRLKYGF
ncbi:MAG: AAA family ATPase [Phycisphaerales bacterium]|nr:AAA family ATPase [Phycisphaerales bacterium]